MVSTVLFVSGMTTLLHTNFGSRLPLIQGPSFVYLAPALAIINSSEFQGLNENVCFSSLFFVFQIMFLLLVVCEMSWAFEFVYCEPFGRVTETKTAEELLCQFSEIQTYNEGAAGGYNHWIGFSNIPWIYRTYVTVSKV